MTRFLIGDSSFCFVNCHLAAHQSHVTERNKDLAQIMKEATFSVIERDHFWENGGDGSSIMDHEHVLWGGDLNYRIDMSRQEVFDAVTAHSFPILWVLANFLTIGQRPAHKTKSCPFSSPNNLFRTSLGVCAYFQIQPWNQPIRQFGKDEGTGILRPYFV